MSAGVRIRRYEASGIRRRPKGCVRERRRCGRSPLLADGVVQKMSGALTSAGGGTEGDAEHGVGVRTAAGIGKKGGGRRRSTGEV